MEGCKLGKNAGWNLEIPGSICYNEVKIRAVIRYTF
jgi:hypothetical protein